MSVPRDTSNITPRRLADLSRTERRRELLRTAVRCLTAIAGLLILYYVLPLSRHVTDSATLIRFGLSTIVFVTVVTWQVQSIIHANLPELRAIETLAVVVPLFLIIYAASYVTLSRLSRSSFSELLNQSSNLYFVIVTFGTVGFGDIMPKSTVARLLVGSQIVGNLVVIGAVFRLVIGISRRTLARTNPGTADGEG